MSPMISIKYCTTLLLTIGSLLFINNTTQAQELPKESTITQILSDTNRADIYLVAIKFKLSGEATIWIGYGYVYHLSIL